MNENINLCEILKDAPEGLPLWCPIFGDLFLSSIDEDFDFPIRTLHSNGESLYFKKDGKWLGWFENTECVLFPSRKQRNWRRFNLPEQEK